MRCAFCHGEGPDVACPGCATWLHARCWTDTIRCPTLGCERRPGPTTWWAKVTAWGYELLSDPHVPPRTPIEWIDLAREAWHGRRSADARGMLDRALQRDPEQPEALLLRALLRRTAGDAPGALADARLALKRGRGRPLGSWLRGWRAAAWLAVGELLAGAGEEAAADAAFAEVDALAASTEEAAWDDLVALRAGAHEARWNVAAAWADLERAPKAPQPPERRARLLRQLGRLDEAQALLDGALGGDGDDGACLGRAVACWQLRVLRGERPASAALERVLEREPRAAEAGFIDFVRGVAHALDGARDDAREAFARAEAREAYLQLHAAHWGAALGLRTPPTPLPDDDPARAADPWAAAQTDLLAGRLDEAGLLELARAAPGPRGRARRLRDAHMLLALQAAGRGDDGAERRHVAAAADRGDFGTTVDVWLHARAARLGERLPHRPPTPDAAPAPPPPARPSGWRGLLRLWLRDLVAVGVQADVGATVAAAARAFEAGEHAAAFRLASSLLALDPDDAFALHVRAWTGLQLGETATSRADAERLLTLPPERLRRHRVEGGAWRARFWLLAGLAAQALDDERAGDAAYAEAEATEGCEAATLAGVRMARWDLEGALAALAALEALAALAAPLLRQLGRFDEALAEYGEALAAGPRPGDLVAIRSARWQVRTIRGDAGADAELAALPDRPERWGLVGIAAALTGDRGAARVAFERAAHGTLSAADAWRWAVSLGLRPATEPPPARDPWQAALTARSSGALDDEALLGRARSASGPRARAARLQEAHTGLALLAHGRGDDAVELRHLRAAAAFGDQGGLLDAWLHGRARRLGSPLEHRPPTPAPSAVA